MDKNTKKNINKKKIIWLVALVAAICIFAFSAFKLINIYLEYQKGKDAYEEIDSMFTEETDTTETGSNPDTTQGETTLTAETAVPWVWDFAKAQSINPDIKGWIKMGNTISYPILQTTDNEYYLTHTVYRKKNSSGAIFIDYSITEGLDAKNCIIYGHDMINNSMFGSLDNYMKESYYKKHPAFEVYIGDRHYTYEIFAVYVTPEVSDTYMYGFPSDEYFKTYLDTSRSKSLYATGCRELTASDRIITLSTCTDKDAERLIVQMVRSNEITE
ncbi:class B sortase [Parasporobacterium paucivorans]|uniref:Sortase B n=1 Tax=Parasporobacterium paucivorans DSM 15970 TaxID=1122934 RepID=A0A1M6D6L9_9FIRM|nr:class B sortase [Parasporobacterium paucivorans]SHI68887.1 sortase B [Parasporobacterium paucivorans DSM 15970]